MPTAMTDINLDVFRNYAGLSLRFDGEVWASVDAPGDPFVYDIQEASDGSLWFRTFRNGVLRYDPSLSGDRAWTRFIRDQLADPPVPIVY